MNIKLLAPMSHPRSVGVRFRFRQLVLRSLRKATAHGAGLMLAPILLKMPSAISPPADGYLPAAVGIGPPAAGGRPMASMDMASMDHESHAEHILMATVGSRGGGPLLARMTVALHTLAMLLAMAGVAMLVYEKIGLAILRTAWLNLDLLWAAALIGAGILTLVL